MRRLIASFIAFMWPRMPEPPYDGYNWNDEPYRSGLETDE